MKSKSAFAASCVAFTLFALAPLASAAPAKETVLIDFTDIRRDPHGGKVFHAYEYTYDQWGRNGVIDVPQRGVLVKAPSGHGGMGENRTMVRFTQTPVVDLIYVIGNENKATSLTFALVDSDGTEQQWSVPLANRPLGQPLRHRIDLENPGSEVKPGKKPGLERKKITTWQVRGDYTDPNVEVLLIKLIAAP